MLYEVPDTWEEVTLSQFNVIQSIIDNEELSALKKSVKILSNLLNVDEKTISKIPLAESKKIDLSFINTEIPKKVEQKFVIDGVTYKPVDFKNISLGEYADLDYYMNKDIMSNIHLITAILVRPEIDGEIEEYDEETVEQRAKIFYERMNIVQLMSVTSFFLTINQTL